jgi:hypothetical protein
VTCCSELAKLLLASCECVTLSLALREQDAFQVLQYTMIAKILALKKDNDIT